jgi:hypothetical protein
MVDTPLFDAVCSGDAARVQKLCDARVNYEQCDTVSINQGFGGSDCWRTPQLNHEVLLPELTPSHPSSEPMPWWSYFNWSSRR